MVVRFVCRGNSYRSIMAEAYLKSKDLPNVQVFSSGTIAAAKRAANKDNFARTLRILKAHELEQFAKDHYGDQFDLSDLGQQDIVIFMNQIVRDESNLRQDQLPVKTFVWDITDKEEIGRALNTEEDVMAYSEDMFQEIMQRVDRLIRDELKV